MTPQQRYAIALYTEGVIRARIEYAEHPHATSCTPRHQCTWNLYRRGK